MRLFSSCLILFIFIIVACSSDKGKGVYKSCSDTASVLSVQEEIKPDELTVFQNMVDSIYPEIRKMKFDTIETKAYITEEDLQKHRMISIILSKNQIKKTDLVKISGLYSCICKHESIKKKDSQDLVIEEYLCKNPKDASFWFDQVYNCYHDCKNPIGEPLKEPYKLWQSSNRIIHIYTRAQMWSVQMDSINKAMMKNFVFTTEEK
jgi:hypothetical protein